MDEDDFISFFESEDVVMHDPILGLVEAAAAANCAAMCEEIFTLPPLLVETSLLGGPGVLALMLFDNVQMGGLVAVVTAKMFETAADGEVSAEGVKTPGGTFELLLQAFLLVKRCVSVLFSVFRIQELLEQVET